ncbi:hypothetical protein [Serratia inhibens]|uniref:hypothetical protein n=1 Tax=Serratia inhibens TaxID=2338073 RepID=UPI0011DFC3C5|nr:hypothetical protein [Serratia inhibens]
MPDKIRSLPVVIIGIPASRPPLLAGCAVSIYLFMFGDALIFSESCNVHGGLLKGQSQYVGISLKVNGWVKRDIYTSGCCTDFAHKISVATLSPSEKQAVREGPYCKGGRILGNKKPDSLEPKKAGLTGSTKWGHQRKAVALIQTTPGKESSRRR